jgi:molybdenum cofactor cytidylyltransferase
MGQPKLLLPWRDTSVIGQLIRTWTELHATQIAVVISNDSSGLQGELTRLGFPPENRIINPHPEQGMFSSIQTAAAWTGWAAGITHWIITLGDQPHLRHSTLEELLRFAALRPERICQPMWCGRPKHPILLPRRYFTLLAASPGPDFKAFLAEHGSSREGFDSDDEGLDLDLDTPSDYHRLRALMDFTDR